MIRTNLATGIAVEAYRKVLQTQRKLEAREAELIRALADPELETDLYFALTVQLDDACDAGRALHDVGLADTARR